MKKKGWLERFLSQGSKEEASGSESERPGWHAGWILRPGQVLVDNYRVTKMIGSPGGMGQVFAAEDTRLGLPVAIKVPALSVLMSPMGAEMFLEEARAAAQLRPHRHIVLINACLTDPGLKITTGDTRAGISIPFIVMEYLGGGDLAQRLQKGPMGFEAAADLFEKICSAVHYAHTCELKVGGKVKRGMIHRDLKPQNICFDEHGRPVVVDFGLARVLEDPSTSGGMKGTPTHMAPEQWNPSRGVDHRTDIYALGVILYQVVTGRLPFSGNSVEEFLSAHLFEPPPDPRRVRPDLPGRVATAILKGLEKEKDARFDSAIAFAQEVVDGLKGQEAASVGPQERVVTPPHSGASGGDEKMNSGSQEKQPPGIPVGAGGEQAALQRCSNCNQRVKPDSVSGKLYCSNCGSPWLPVPEPAASSQSNVSTSSPRLDSQACPSCGSNAPPSMIRGVPYCSECGIRLPDRQSQPHAVVEGSNSASTTSCPSCGSSAPPDKVAGILYCSECGSPFPDRQSPSHVDVSESKSEPADPSSQALPANSMGEISKQAEESNRWTELQPSGDLPSARWSHLAVWDEDRERMYVIGGSGENFQSYYDLWTYDARNNHWNKLTPTGSSPPSTLTLRAALDATKRKIYIIGDGYLSDGNTSASGMWIYGLDTNAWEYNEIPTELKDLVANDVAWDSNRGHIYAFGGGGTGEESNALWVFNSEIYSWNKLEPVGGSPPARNNHSLVWDPNGDRLIVFGGIGGGGGTFYNDLWIYSASTNSWKMQRPRGDLPFARLGHSATWDPIESKMYVFGGFSPGSAPVRHNDLWVYETESNKWTRMSPSGSIPPARSGHSAVVALNSRKLYIFGGLGEVPHTGIQLLFNDLWEFNLPRLSNLK